MRSRGTFLPRKTFSRNGSTSSCFSGPPKETTSSASNEFMGSANFKSSCPLKSLKALPHSYNLQPCTLQPFQSQLYPRLPYCFSAQPQAPCKSLTPPPISRQPILMQSSSA